MTTKIDTAKDKIDIYNAETGQVAEATPHVVVESSLAQGTGIVLSSSASTGKVTVSLDPAALGGGGETVNINGLTTVSTDGVTITGNGATTPLVAHAIAVADNDTIKGDGSVASPFYAPGAAAVYEYTIANGVSSFQSDSMAPYKTVLFSVTNLATSWGLWPVANNLDAAAMGLSGLSGIPRGTTANILLDMAGAQVNMLANTLNQFVNGAAFGRLEKMTVRFGNESASVSRWFGTKSVPTAYDIGSKATSPAISGSRTWPWTPSFCNLGPYTEYTVDAITGDGIVMVLPIVPDKVNVGGIDSFLQGMTGTAFRLRTVYHNNNMNPGAITPFGTFVSGTVRLVCYK